MTWFFGSILSALLWIFTTALKATQRLDFDPSVDRFMFVPGYGHLLALPTRPGTTSTATTGVPTAGVGGFAVSCLFLNFKGSVGSLLYVNSGTNTSATWTNVV
jgi:hypothetical protein